MKKVSRTQYLHSRANDITQTDLPKGWGRTAVVQFSPVADEVDFSLLNAFPDALKGATNPGVVTKMGCRWKSECQKHGLGKAQGCGRGHNE